MTTRTGISGLASRPRGVSTLVASASAVRNRGGRWRLREWRLRTKLTAVLLVPLVLAGVLGALRVTELMRRANGSVALARQVGFAQQLGVVIHGLQGERYQAAVIQAGDRAVNPAELAAQVARVDSAVAALRSADGTAKSFPAAARAQWEPAHRAVLSRLSGLAAFRQAVHPPNAVPGYLSATNTVAAYSDLMALALELDRQALSGVPEELAHQAEGIKALTVAQEQASWEHASLQVGILTDGLSTEQQVMLRTADARFEAAAAEFGQATSTAQRQQYFAARTMTDRKRLLDTALDRAVRGAPLETVPGDWNSAAAGTVETIWQGQTTQFGELRRAAGMRGDQALSEAFWDGAVVAVALLLAIGLLVVVLRSLLQPLRALRTAAFEVADRRLPEAVEQLRTEGVPGQTRVDPVPVHSREEVGQVARAFDTMHVQAVRLATEQAQLRSCLNDVCLSLSGRNQGLLERQLRLIEELRAYTAEPELLRRIEALDRLAARMRRHSESLLVVAGGTQRRGTGVPAAVLDVFRDAISEIEHDARVTLSSCPAATVDGAVVTDLIHLIAELLDNATGVSPYGATVTLSGSLSEDNGLQLEITDSGPGLPANELATINARLAAAPTADPADPLAAGQLGLFVVRELATRHGITVRLRQRLGGSGVTATALLPPSLVTVDLRVPAVRPESPADPRRPATESLSANGRGHVPAQPPLQVSVIDAATAADLFNPASISAEWLGAGDSSRGSPRTAHEEWLELFGPPASGPAVDVLGGATPQPRTPAAEDSQVREEIYEMVSAWFREQQLASANETRSAVENDWRSPFDEGWQAAQALRQPIDHELTGSGLPKRQPRAHLVSGSDGPVSPAPVPAALTRTPEDVRGRLSRYQRGLRVGRHARTDPDEQLVWTQRLARPFGDDSDDYGPSEEYQQ